MFFGKGKGENRILKEFVWRIIFKIFSPKYLVVRRTTRSQSLVVLTHFLVVEDTRTREFCYPAQCQACYVFNLHKSICCYQLQLIGKDTFFSFFGKGHYYTDAR